MIRRFPAIYQTLPETSIPWKGPSSEERVPFDTSSIRLCSRHQNSRWWHSYIWWFLVKTCKWNMFFQRVFSRGKQDYLFKIPLISGNFPVECPQRVISAPLRSTTWLEKPLGLFWLFRPSTADIAIRYKTSSITFKHVVEKLERSWATVYTEYCQNKGQKKPAGKNPSREKNLAGNLGRVHGSCSEKPILRRLHGWKVFALIYKTSIPTKDSKL